MCAITPAVITLDPRAATYEAIANVVGNTIGQEFRVEVAGRKLVVVRKCTYQNGLVKPNYRHIMRVREWGGQVLQHFREDKNGNFKPL